MKQTGREQETTVVFVEHLFEMTESRSAGHGPVYVDCPMKRAHFPCLILRFWNKGWHHESTYARNYCTDVTLRVMTRYFTSQADWYGDDHTDFIISSEPNPPHDWRCLCSDTLQRQNHSTLEGVTWSPCIYYDLLLSNLSDQYLRQASLALFINAVTHNNRINLHPLPFFPNSDWQMQILCMSNPAWIPHCFSH